GPLLIGNHIRRSSTSTSGAPLWTKFSSFVTGRHTFATLSSIRSPRVAGGSDPHPGWGFGVVATSRRDTAYAAGAARERCHSSAGTGLKHATLWPGSTSS